jgi:hypothetical protein
MIGRMFHILEYPAFSVCLIKSVARNHTLLRAGGKGERLPERSPASQEAKALRSKQERAGRKPAASDRGVIPETIDRKIEVGGHPELMGSQELKGRSG